MTKEVLSWIQKVPKLKVNDQFISKLELKFGTDSLRDLGFNLKSNPSKK